MHALSIEMIMRDTQAMLSYADQQQAANAKSIGAVGYCMSGPFVFAAAARYPERIKCAASIYGAGLVTDKDESPHLTAAKITGEMYFAVAETDIYAPPEVITQLDAHLRTAGTNYRIEHYPGTHHGFAFPKRQGIYHHEGAERHWERLFALFRRNLA
jgi:carboxymethylenebutenolidase